VLSTVQLVKLSTDSGNGGQSITALQATGGRPVMHMQRQQHRQQSGNVTVSSTYSGVIQVSDSRET
jgi:hypothetical protein